MEAGVDSLAATGSSRLARGQGLTLADARL